MKKLFFLPVIIFLISSCKKELTTPLNYSDGSINTFKIDELQSQKLKPISATTVKDIDGNIYKTVVIGNQEWMAENLRVSRYRNGDPILFVNEKVTQWDQVNSGAWCYYNNDPSFNSAYGKFYNWKAVMDPRGLAPKGWHVPSQAEWDELITTLGGAGVAGGKMKTVGTKEAGTGEWFAPNTGATNSSGFSALPHGYIYSNSANMGTSVFFWTSTEYTTDNAHAKILYYASENVTVGNESSWSKKYGLTVRCIKDRVIVKK